MAMRKQLSKRKIPEDFWHYYLETPEHWDFEDTTKEGLQRAIEAILMSSNTVTPCWVEKESVNKFVDIKNALGCGNAPVSYWCKLRIGFPP